MQTSKRAAPPDRRNAAEGQHSCACIGKCNPCRCGTQAAQPAAFWREVTPSQCAAELRARALSHLRRAEEIEQALRGMGVRT